MMRKIRTTREKMFSAEGADTTDKTRIREYTDAATTLQKSVNEFFKSYLDHNNHISRLHEDLANLYPANAKLSVAVAQLAANNGVFKDAPKLVEDLKATLSAPISSIITKCKALMESAEERQVCRAEITHYREKVAKLANEGLVKIKAQQKAESNQEKLFANQKRFQELDTKIGEELKALDGVIADLTNAGIGQYVQLNANYATALLQCYGNAIAAIQGCVRSGGQVAAAATDSDVPTKAEGAPEVPSTPSLAGLFSPTSPSTEPPAPVANITMSAFTAEEQAAITEANDAGSKDEKVVPPTVTYPATPNEAKSVAAAGNPFGDDPESSSAAPAVAVSSGIESPFATPPPAPEEGEAEPAAPKEADPDKEKGEGEAAVAPPAAPAEAHKQEEAEKEKEKSDSDDD